jgi:hypothetical protein
MRARAAAEAHTEAPYRSATAGALRKCQGAVSSTTTGASARATSPSSERQSATSGSINTSASRCR